jgi:hypothetical protein
MQIPRQDDFYCETLWGAPDTMAGFSLGSLCCAGCCRRNS